jgi:hypothetical protein
MWNWLLANREWVFSGVGVALVTAVLALRRRNNRPSQSQTAGNSSTNIQAGRDIQLPDIPNPRSDARE